MTGCNTLAAATARVLPLCVQWFSYYKMRRGEVDVHAENTRPKVTALAQEVMRLRGAPNMTAAIELSLKNYIEDLDRAALAKTPDKDQPASNP